MVWNISSNARQPSKVERHEKQPLAPTSGSCDRLGQPGTTSTIRGAKRLDLK
jgi:hypothetical protein